MKDQFHHSHCCGWCIGITLQHYFACKGFNGGFDGVAGFVLTGYSNLELPIGKVYGESIFCCCHSSENHGLILDGAIVFPGDIIPED